MNTTLLSVPPVHKTYKYVLPHLSAFFPHSHYDSPTHTNNSHSLNATYGSSNNLLNLADNPSPSNSGSVRTSGPKYNNLVTEDEVIVSDARRTLSSPASLKCYVRAGARRDLHFNPREVKAAIVTCGGLCPGLNNVIREITRSLKINYGSSTVYGVTGGFSGFQREPIVLTPKSVENIHHSGGTVLGSARGGEIMWGS